MTSCALDNYLFKFVFFSYFLSYSFSYTLFSLPASFTNAETNGFSFSNFSFNNLGGFFALFLLNFLRNYFFKNVLFGSFARCFFLFCHFLHLFLLFHLKNVTKMPEIFSRKMRPNYICIFLINKKVGVHETFSRLCNLQGINLNTQVLILILFQTFRKQKRITRVIVFLWLYVLNGSENLTTRFWQHISPS